MPFLLKNSRTFRWLFRLFKYSAIFIISLILLASVILVILPTAVSTDWSHRFIQDKISDALDRPVAVEKLDWSWSDGIIINKLAIPDLPEFSKNSLVSLEHVALKINVKRLLHRELNFEFLLNDLDVNIIKNSSGTLNIETLGQKDLTPKKPPALPEKDEIPENKPDEKPDEKKTSEKKEKKPFVLPIEISGTIGFTGINLFYDDREKSETYKVKDLEITLDAPSVKTAPINLAVGTVIIVNDQTIPRATINASLKNLFNANGALNIDGLFASLDVDLPGIVADVDADMAASELKSNIKIDLASLMEVAVPLIPEFPSPTDIKGAIVLTAATGTRPDEPLAFDATLSGSNLAVSGKVLDGETTDGKSIGPGNFSVHLNGVVDLQSEKLDLATGDIHILENSHINASAQVEQLKQDNKKIHLAISPLFLDLNEITAFASAFIPAIVEIDNQGKQAAISFKELKFDGQLPNGRADVMLDDLEINLPKIGLTDKTDGKSMLRVSGTRVNIEKLAASLTDLFPESAALKISLAVDELINGKEPNEIKVSGIRLNQLNAAAAAIQKTDKSGFGITAELTVDNKLKIEQIQLPDLLQINNLAQSINIKAALRPDKTIIGSIEHLDVTCRKVSVLKEDITPIDSGINIHLALDKVFLKNLDPINVDIKNFFAGLKLDDAVAVSIIADAADMANTSFNVDVKIDSDLNALVKKIPSKFLSGISSAGNLDISLNTAGRRPDAEEIDLLKKKQFTDNLTFLDRFNFGINLENGSVEISKQDQNPIIIESITANPLLSYELFGKTGKGDIVSAITVASLKGLPGLNPDAPLSSELSLSASHDYAKTINLDQSLTVSPAGIDESIHITIDGLDRIISRSPLPGLPMWISKMGADISANVKIPDCTALKAMGLPGLSETDLDGLISAGIAFALIPDHSVDGSISLTVNDMNFTMPKTVSVEKVNANIDFAKSYRIQSADKAQPFSDRAGLSANVIDSGRQSSLFSQNSDIYRHIRLLHERMNPEPAILFQKADVLAAPFPLIIDESMVMLNLNKGLPNLDYFRFNLLGGTINGSIALVKKQAQTKNPFHVSTALTFSGINTAQFFPGAFSKDDYSKADISGSLYADFPVTDQLQTILEDAAITVEFTRIGSRALERMLYALDPYESNEAIVSQRRLLKSGSPKKIRLDIKDGFLSLRGKVAIKGIEISLPAIRRLNIAQVPGLDRFGEKLSGLTPVIAILQKISAEKIVINKQKNSINFE